MSPSSNSKNDQNGKVVISAINPSHVTVYETRTQMHHHIQKSGKLAQVLGSTGPKCFANSYLPPPFHSIWRMFYKTHYNGPGKNIEGILHKLKQVPL